MSPRRPSAAEVPTPQVNLEMCPHTGARISLRIGGDVSFVHCPECEAKGWVTSDGRTISRDEAIARLQRT